MDVSKGKQQIEPHSTKGYEEGQPVGGARSFTHKDGRTILFSLDAPWIHVSVSRTDRIPDWEDLRLTKLAFIGPSRYAIQIVPPVDEYVNIHPNCLHLWSPLNDDILGSLQRKETRE